jgi:hypothetical protein
VFRGFLALSLFADFLHMHLLDFLDGKQYGTVCIDSFLMLTN